MCQMNDQQSYLFALIKDVYNQHQDNLNEAFKVDLLHAAQCLQENEAVGLVSSQLYRSILDKAANTGLNEVTVLYDFVRDQKNRYELKQNIGQLGTIRFL